MTDASWLRRISAAAATATVTIAMEFIHMLTVAPSAARPRVSASSTADATLICSAAPGRANIRNTDMIAASSPNDPEPTMRASSSVKSSVTTVDATTAAPMPPEGEDWGVVRIVERPGMGAPPSARAPVAARRACSRRPCPR